MHKLAYACVLTRNIEQLAAFYRAVLTVEPEWNGPYAEFSTGPCAFSLWSVDAYAELAGMAGVPEHLAGGVMLEFEVDDVDAEFLRLGKLPAFHVDFIIPPTTMAWGNRSIYVRDPDGNLLNLFSHVAPG